MRHFVPVLCWLTFTACSSDSFPADDPDQTDIMMDVGPDLVTESDGAVEPLLVECGEESLVLMQTDLDQVDGCERLMGSLHLVDYHEESVPEIRELKHIEGGFVVHRAYDLTTLDDLRGLTSVGQSFVLLDITALGQEYTVPLLETVGATLELGALPVKNLNFPSLEVVGGLTIFSTEFDSFEGFPKLRRVIGDIDILSEEISQHEFEDFLGRVEVTGSVRFNGEIYTQ